MRNRPCILRDFSGIGQGHREYGVACPFCRCRLGYPSRWIADLDEPMPEPKPFGQMRAKCLNSIAFGSMMASG